MKSISFSSAAICFRLLTLSVLGCSIIACGDKPDRHHVHSTLKKVPVAESEESALDSGRDLPLTTTDDVVESTPRLTRSTPETDHIAALYRHLEKPSRTYTLSTHHDTVITCAEGTTISIKAGSFLSAKTGEPVTGDVVLEVKEFYSTPDILLANLTTMSGDDMLETGGMLYLGATAGGDACRLGDSAEVELGFPRERFKGGMQLFSGTWGPDGIEWKPFSEPVITTVNLVRKIAPDTVAVVSEPVPPLVFDEPTSYELVDKAPNSLQGVRLRREGIRMVIRDSVFDSSTKAWVKTNRLTIGSKWVRYDSGDIDMAVEVPRSSIPICTRTSRNDQGMDKEISRYILTTSRLGWINCDRFIRERGPKTDVIIATEEAEEVDIKLIFHSINSVLGGRRWGNEYRFRNIPIGYDVTVIAIKHERGQYHIARKRTTVSKEGISDLAFEPMTMDGLKDVVAGL